MTEKELRKRLLEALNSIEKNKRTNSLIIPEADRWDIAIIRDSNFIAGIELKNHIVSLTKKNVKNWYSKHGSKCEVEEKQELDIGTIRKFGDTWYNQEGDPFGQATTYYLHSESSSEPENVLVVEVDVSKVKKEEKKYKYRVSNITQWAVETKKRKQNQGQEITPKLEEIKRKEGEGNLNEIATEIYKSLDC